MHLGIHSIKYTYRTAVDINLRETTVAKDLSMYVDHELNFVLHIQQSIRKANRLLGLI